VARANPNTAQNEKIRKAAPIALKITPGEGKLDVLPSSCTTTKFEAASTAKRPMTMTNDAARDMYAVIL
jgi:hypothetical protein